MGWCHQFLVSLDIIFDLNMTVSYVELHTDLMLLFLKQCIFLKNERSYWKCNIKSLNILVTIHIGWCPFALNMPFTKNISQCQSKSGECQLKPRFTAKEHRAVLLQNAKIAFTNGLHPHSDRAPILAPSPAAGKFARFHFCCTHSYRRHLKVSPLTAGRFARDLMACHKWNTNLYFIFHPQRNSTGW